MDPLTTTVLVNTATAIVKATGLAEWIGRKLGGEMGARAAEQIVDVAAIAAGVQDPDELTKALAADRELAGRVRLALLDHAHELEKLAFADLRDARALQAAALQQQDLFSKRFIYYFAIAWSLAVMCYIGAITFIPIPADNERFADTILGFVLGTIMAGMFQFFFGSSSGSKLKNEMLSKLVANTDRSKL